LIGKFVLAVIFGIILASVLPSSFSTHPSIEGATKMIVLGPEDFVAPNLGFSFPEKLNSLTLIQSSISAAPVDIPDGATITGIECRVTDNSDNVIQGDDISCSLVQVAHSDGTSTEIIKFETTGAPGTITLSDMTLHHLVDRDANHYGIVSKATLGCFGDCQLHSVKITYTISVSPGPFNAFVQALDTLLSVMGTMSEAIGTAFVLIGNEINDRAAGDAALQAQIDSLPGPQVYEISEVSIIPAGEIFGNRVEIRCLDGDRFLELSPNLVMTLDPAIRENFNIGIERTDTKQIIKQIPGTFQNSILIGFEASVRNVGAEKPPFDIEVTVTGVCISPSP